MHYILDTNIISEVMRRQPDPNVLRWFKDLDRIIISSVTVDEVVFGLSRKGLVEKLAWFRQFCDDKVTILGVDDRIANSSGERRAVLEGKGITIHMADSLIAATAALSGLVLATRNTRDFEHMGIALYNPFE